MYKPSKHLFRNIHNEAMDIVMFAKIGFDPQCRDRVFSEEDKLHEYEKAFELEKQAVALIRARYDQTQSDGDKLTESIYSRSATWVGIKAEKYAEAEKIAVTALARGVHPVEKRRLYDALFAAISKQGISIPIEREEPEKEPELATA